LRTSWEHARNNKIPNTPTPPAKEKKNLTRLMAKTCIFLLKQNFKSFVDIEKTKKLIKFLH
jgi:hypothetical protein